MLMTFVVNISFRWKNSYGNTQEVLKFSDDVLN